MPALFLFCNTLALHWGDVKTASLLHLSSRFINSKPLDVNIVQVLNVQNYEPSWVELSNILQIIWVLCNTMWASQDNTQGHFLQIRPAAIRRSSYSVTRMKRFSPRGAWGQLQQHVALQTRVSVFVHVFCKHASSCRSSLLFLLTAFRRGLWLNTEYWIWIWTSLPAAQLDETTFTKLQFSLFWA